MNIKEIMEKCYKWLKQFFTLRLDNPTVEKMLVQPKRKGIFRKLYQEGNEAVVSFIDDIMQ